MNKSGDRVIEARVEALRERLDARAAGFWDVEGDRLTMRAFAHAPDMPGDVVRRFVESASSVGLDRVDLGIVNAVAARTVAVSVAGRLPVTTGSGFWLRAFGAARSVAVPITGPGGAICAVCSAALPTLGPPDDEAIAAVIRDHGAPGVS